MFPVDGTSCAETRCSDILHVLYILNLLVKYKDKVIVCNFVPSFPNFKTGKGEFWVES